MIMVEPWVYEINLAEIPNKINDPERPLSLETKKQPTKRDCTCFGSVQFCQTSMCLRQFFGNYLDDDSPSGESNLFKPSHD